MEEWEIALHKFLKKWISKKEVIGVLVCGSYVTGNPTKHSDIDLHIILDDSCKWRLRGNEIIDEYLIEYFVNPSRQIKKYFEMDHERRSRINAHMFITGKVVYDEKGDVKKLIALAKKYMKKPLKKLKGALLEIRKYHLWNNCDNFEEVVMRGDKDISYCYFNYLDDLFRTYCEYLGYVDIQHNKVKRFLTNKRDMEKYHINAFPDEEFLKKFIKALEVKEERMLSTFKNLNEYVLNKMGGMNVDGWKIKTPVEK